MSGQIRCVYAADPKFPATDQHPAAVRFQVGPHVVDAVGGQPTLAEVQAFLGIDAAGQAEFQRKIDIDTAIDTDATIASLKAMTSAQLDTWFNANVTDLASARNLLRLMFKILVRRVL